MGIHDYTVEKGAVVFLMVLYKVIDALADTYEAEFQRTGRLYLTGKSNAFRTLLSVTVFLSALTVTKELVMASVLAVAAQILGFLLFDAAVIRRLPEVDWGSGAGKKWRLLKDNTLLFFSVILDFYIFSASKYAIENCMADRDLAVYGAIFMPTSVINLVAGFVIRPYLTKLSLSWETGRLSQYAKQIRQLAAIIAALTVLALGGAWLLGIPVLSLLYSNLSYALKSCRPALLLIILGGALNAFMNLFYYSLIIMKKQRLILLGYGLTALLAVLFSDGFVIWGGIFGGALIYVLLQAALTAVFALSPGWYLRKRKGKLGEYDPCFCNLCLRKKSLFGKLHPLPASADGAFGDLYRHLHAVGAYPAFGEKVRPSSLGPPGRKRNPGGLALCLAGRRKTQASHYHRPSGRLLLQGLRENRFGHV